MLFTVYWNLYPGSIGMTQNVNVLQFSNLSYLILSFWGLIWNLQQDGSKALLKGNPSASSDALLKAHKSLRGPSKREIWDHRDLSSTKTKILQLLHGFTSQFLMGGYNGTDFSIHCNKYVTSFFFVILYFIYSFIQFCSHQFWCSQSVKILIKKIRKSRALILSCFLGWLNLSHLTNITLV